eukprot:106972_1
MSNNHGISVECCESIIEDLLNIVNDNTVVELKWKIPVSLYNIETLLLTTNLKSNCLTLETYVSDQRNSLTIIPVITDDSPEQMIMLKRTHRNNMITQSNKRSTEDVFRLAFQKNKKLISGFICQLLKQYKCRYIVPVDIIHLCCMYFAPLKYEYVDITHKNTSITPFDILFANFRSEPGIPSNNSQQIDISEQVQYLIDSQINTTYRRQVVSDSLPICQGVSEILSMYYQYSCILSKSTELNIRFWHPHDVVISFMHYLINKYAIDDPDSRAKTLKRPKVWQFIEYFRKYCWETNCDGE